MSHPIIKAVGDDHVDRRQVEVQKWMEPSRTNEPVRLVSTQRPDRVACERVKQYKCVAEAFFSMGKRQRHSRAESPARAIDKGKARDIGGW